ncbi:sugar ABC transporter substrate-binding protein [Lysinibacillus sp. NPDC098008]|uniref:sugar ABC transporter substrate-binding protein n=1 Tax=Lysinibacillus sp. NPDC098008 TaxID=3364146 RepID=UPI00382BE9CE
MKKLLGVLVLSLVMILTACSSDSSAPKSNNASSDGKKLKIGVVLMSLNSEYWKIHEAGAKKAAADLGVDVEVLGPAEETLYEEQVRMVEDFISAGVDGLVVAASLPEAMLPALQKANAQGIPVVLADANVESFKEAVTFIGTENYDAAYKGGEYANTLLKAGDKVLIIRGQMGAKVHDERTNGFQDALKELGIEAIVQDAQSDRMKAVNIVENTLTAEPDIKLVFATSDEMALGAYTGLSNKGSNIPVIGFDGTPDGLNSVKEEHMVANIAQDPFQMGYLGIESVVKATKDEPVEKRIDSGSEVYTVETVEKRIEELNSYLGK